MESNYVSLESNSMQQIVTTEVLRRCIELVLTGENVHYFKCSFEFFGVFLEFHFSKMPQQQVQQTTTLAVNTVNCGLVNTVQHVKETFILVHF